MKYFTLYKSFLIVVCMILFVMPLQQGEAFAFRINKGSFRVQLSKGETYNGAVEIDNSTEQPLVVKAYMNDFVYVSPFNGDKEFYPPDSTKVSLAKWINFSPHELTVPPYSKGSVNFTVLPDEEFDSVRCGVLFFESSVGVTYEEERAINVLGRIGTLVFVEPKIKEKNINFYNIEGTNRKIGGSLKNTGNTFLHLKGTYFVMDNEGMVKDRGEVKEVYFLSGDQTTLDVTLSQTLSSGSYMLILTFDLEDGDIAVKEIDFSVSSLGEVEILGIRD
ncbi:MAG: hypothetical protein ABIH71_05805 [Candidatus Omnitrophota bacterium]